MSMSWSSTGESREIHPQNWKQQALHVLVQIWPSTTHAPGFEAVRQGFQKVILTALDALEDRMTKYAQFLAGKELEAASDSIRGTEGMEQSLRFYFEEKWRVLKEGPDMFGTKMWDPGNPGMILEVPPDYEDSSSDEETGSHQRALALCRESFLQTLDVSSTSLLGPLVADDVISERHAKRISQMNRRDKILEIIDVTNKMSLDQFQRTFLPALRADSRNKLLAKQLESCMEGRGSSPPSTVESECRRCSLRERIDLHFLTPLLLERRLISLQFYEILTERSLTEEKAWQSLFSAVGHTQKILPVLSEYYPKVVVEMQKYDISSLECSCSSSQTPVAAGVDASLGVDSSDVVRRSDVVGHHGERHSPVERPLLTHVRQDHPTRAVAGCRLCSLRARIDLFDLADGLLSKGFIYQGLWREIKTRTLSENEAWVKIFQSCKEINWLPVLQGMYSRIAEEMAEQKVFNLACSCLYQSVSPSETFKSLGRKSGSTTITDSSRLSVPKYPLKPSAIGICWVVVNSGMKHIHSKVGEWRKVSEKSAMIMEKTFSGLGFEIIRHDNLSAKDLTEEARKLAKLDHSRNDCFACIVFSQYGDKDKILCSDGSTMSFSGLTQIFSASKCPALAGKPKIFYRPGPRGASNLSGVLVGKDGQESVPDQADFVLIYSCPPECSAGKDKRSSALRHVQRLGEVLDQHGSSKDFLTCLTMANSNISGNKPDRVAYFTAPFQSTLRKKLIFGHAY